MRTVLHRGETGFPIEQVITDQDGAVVNLTGLTVKFRLRLEYSAANIVDDSGAQVLAPETAGKVRWTAAVPADAPLGIADGMWVFSNGEQVDAGQFLIEESFGAGTGGTGAVLAAYALTTLDRVKSRISGMRGKNTVGDQDIIQLINAASLEMIEYADREFAPITPNPSSRSVWVPSSGYARIPDCRGLTAAAPLLPDATVGTPYVAGTATAAGEWMLAGYWRVSNTFTAIDLGAAAVPPLGLVRLTGDWGWSSVPEHIKHLCTQQVKMWYEDDRIRPQQFDADEGPAPDYNSMSLAAAVRAALYRYRIPTVG